MKDDRIETVRRFNRYYTRRIGVLHEGLLDSPYTLTESRLLWELAHHEPMTATELSRLLDLDAGYMSRMLSSFKAKGLVEATRSTGDARQQHLRLTPAGRAAFQPLNARSQAEIGALLGRLEAHGQDRLLRAMGEIEQLLDPAVADIAEPSPCMLRPPRPGDMGWIVSRHGALYAEEYAFDSHFEALVARIAADFVDRYDAQREACWIAERDGAPIGGVMLVQARDDATQAPVDGVAQLRLLLVEPSARGLGLGVRLVAECERHARAAGYRKIVLWTNSLLHAARGIYRRAGYVLTGSEPHKSFGHDLVGETWELRL